MRTEFLLILAVLVALLALTAIRYRKQIAGMISFARMLREAKRSASVGQSTFPDAVPKSTQLVSCSKCDIWVPQDKAVKFREGFICSEVCQNAATQVQR